MKIVFAPHTALRQTAKPITQVDKKLHDFIKDLSTTLITNERKGVGLAAPQVDKQWRMFVTYLSPDEGAERDDNRQLSVYLNPRIVKTSRQKELGGTKKDRPLEGCLSIPGLYGPVPRFKEVTVEFEKIEGDRLVSAQQTFIDFPARLVQHEIDHLDGILFTDYSLELGLPIYQEDEQGELVLMEERHLVELF